jgi:hypothetical protein
MRSFSVKTQLYYLKNQLHVLATVSSHYQLSGRFKEYKEKDITQLQYVALFVQQINSCVYTESTEVVIAIISLSLSVLNRTDVQCHFICKWEM